MTFDPTRPADRDIIGDVAGLWRSDKSSLDSFLQSFLHWSNDADDAGKPTGGSAATASGVRAFFVPRSQVSYRRDGDLFLVSDESKLVIAISDQSVPLFTDKSVIQYGSHVGSNLISIESQSRYLTTHGNNTLTTNGVVNVTFGVTYGATPFVTFGQSSTNDTSTTSFVVGITAINASGMSVRAHYAGPGGAPGNVCRLYWRSSGTTAVI